MSASATNLQHKRLPSDTEHAQRISEIDPSQQMRLRERQRFFFEEVFQHDVDVYLSSSHLQIDYKRPPIGSISSMEVNVDMLEQLELLDLSDQDALDVFFSAAGDDGVLASSLPGQEEEEEPGEDGFTLHVPNSSSVKSRISSTSSAASYDSQGTNGEGAETPTIQSEDEEGHSDNLLLTPTGIDEKKAPPFFSP